VGRRIWSATPGRYTRYRGLTGRDRTVQLRLWVEDLGVNGNYLLPRELSPHDSRNPADQSGRIRISDVMRKFSFLRKNRRIEYNARSVKAVVFV
jgi:hypothetical protein